MKTQAIWHNWACADLTGFTRTIQTCGSTKFWCMPNPRSICLILPALFKCAGQQSFDACQILNQFVWFYPHHSNVRVNEALVYVKSTINLSDFTRTLQMCGSTKLWCMLNPRVICLILPALLKCAGQQSFGACQIHDQFVFQKSTNFNVLRAHFTCAGQQFS